MSEVKRYHMTAKPDEDGRYAKMVISKNGAYIWHTDYASLSKRLAELQSTVGAYLDSQHTEKGLRVLDRAFEASKETK